MMSSSSNGQFGGNTLSAILTSLQQGVTGINNLIQTMKSVFPSST